ncbi:hypothetical protein [Nostoc sp. TCL26-01]|nr:hypothetical protein [Nostoc sp. TCL26-01]
MSDCRRKDAKKNAKITTFARGLLNIIGGLCDRLYLTRVRSLL